MRQAVLALAALTALFAIIPLSQGNVIVAGVLYLALLGVAILYMRTQPAPPPHDPRDNN